MRLIDADTLIKELESNSWDIDEWELPHEQVSAGLMANAYDLETVKKMPTVDAVPVIRCRECSHLQGAYLGDYHAWICMKLHRQVWEHNYCCWAERKKNEQV